MTRRETRFTNLLRSRGIGFIITAVSAWMTWICIPSFMPEGLFAVMPELSWAINLALLIAVAGVMITVNRQFNLLRTVSVFFSAYFLFITASTPEASVFAGVGTILALAAMLGMWILFTIYNERCSDRRIFLIFTLLSAGTLADWHFLFFVPVFIVGLAQMRILRFKKVMAMLIGLVTPPWIAFGLGLMPIPTLPHIFFTPPSMLLSMPGGWPFLCTVLLTIIVGFLLGLANLIRIIGFNAQARAYNGFLSLLGITTGVLAIVNFTDLQVYVPLLNACVAFQVGHFFRATASRRGYILILGLLASYTALYLWATAT